MKLKVRKTHLSDKGNTIVNLETTRKVKSLAGKIVERKDFLGYLILGDQVEDYPEGTEFTIDMANYSIRKSQFLNEDGLVIEGKWLEEN